MDLTVLVLGVLCALIILRCCSSVPQGQIRKQILFSQVKKEAENRENGCFWKGKANNWIQKAREVIALYLLESQVLQKCMHKNPGCGFQFYILTHYLGLISKVLEFLLTFKVSLFLSTGGGNFNCCEISFYKNNTLSQSRPSP